MSDLPFDELETGFNAGAAAGLEAMVEKLKSTRDHHALFRILLLKKRFELELPLLNPGDLPGASAETRKSYEDYVESTCREIGERYLNDKDLVLAWRYFRSLSEKEPVRKALEKLNAKDATDDELNIAIDQGVH